MAINNNPNAWNGGAVVVSSAPWLNFAIKNEAQKRAKEEAYDNYVQGQSKELLNRNGVRPQEQEDFMGKVGAWQKYSIENKRLLQSGDVGAKNKALELYNDAMTYAAQSKSLNDINKEQILKLKTDPKTWDMVGDRTRAAIDGHNRKIGDPLHKPFNFNTDLDYNAPPAEWDKIDGAIDKQFPVGKLLETEKRQAIVGNPWEVKLVGKTGRAKDVLTQIGDYGKSAYATNPSLKQFADKELMPLLEPVKNPITGELEPSDDYRAFDALFLEKTGRQMDLSTDRSDALAAYFMKRYDKQLDYSETKPNKDYEREVKMADAETNRQRNAASQVQVASTKKRLGLSGGSDDEGEKSGYDVWTPIYNAQKEAQSKGKKIDMSTLPAIAVSSLMDQARKIMPSVVGSIIGPSEINLNINSKGQLLLMDKENNAVGVLESDVLNPIANSTMGISAKKSAAKKVDAELRATGIEPQSAKGKAMKAYSKISASSKSKLKETPKAKSTKSWKDRATKPNQ